MVDVLFNNSSNKTLEMKTIPEVGEIKISLIIKYLTPPEPRTKSKWQKIFRLISRKNKKYNIT